MLGMKRLDIKLDGDNCWPELRDGDRMIVGDLTGVALLPDATTQSGAKVPGVTLRVDLPDGRSVLALVKLELLSAALRACQGRLDYLAEQRAAGKADA